MERITLVALMFAGIGYACGTADSPGSFPGTANAATPVVCETWEIAIVDYEDDLNSKGCTLRRPCEVTDGWEPFTADIYYAHDLMMRRCVN